MNFTLHTASQELTTEERLIQGCISGDRLFQKQLYELYYNKMMCICMRYANGQESARDILNEGFLKVFNHIGNYQPTHPLETWIKRIMVNTAIDHYRQHKKHQYQTDLDQATYEVDPNADNIISQMSADEILAMVQQLSPAYRTVFNLYVIEGYSHREIADMLKINEGTSKSNLAKAKQRLQQLIKTNYPTFQY